MKKIKNVLKNAVSEALNAVAIVLAYIIGISIVVIGTVFVATILAPLDALSSAIKYGDSFAKEYADLMDAYFMGIKEGMEMLDI